MTSFLEIVILEKGQLKYTIITLEFQGEGFYNIATLYRRNASPIVVLVAFLTECRVRKGDAVSTERRIPTGRKQQFC